MKQTASLDKIISSVGYAFEMYISEFSGMSDFNEEEMEQERKEAIDFIKSQQEKIEQLQQKWIPVSERIPEDGSDILVYCDDGEESRIVACNYDNGVWFDCVFNTVMVFKNITHWMPLPKPPKKEGERA